MFPCIVKHSQRERDWGHEERKKKKEIKKERKKESYWMGSKIARKCATECWNKQIWYSVQFQAGPEARQAGDKHNY